MPKNSYGQTMVEQAPVEDADDLVSQTSGAQSTLTAQYGGKGDGESSQAVAELPSDPSLMTSWGEGAAVAGVDDEVSSPGTESGEEYVEASASQLTAEAGEETALSDLQGIEGFEMPEAAEDGVPSRLQEAGTVLTGGQEEFFRSSPPWRRH